MGLSVRLPARLQRMVARGAKERGVTKSEVICSALTTLEHERWPRLFGQHVPFLQWRLAVF